MSLSPLNRRRLANFRANRRAAWSLRLFTALLLASLVAEGIANDRPLLVRYDGSWYVPVLRDYPETEFGGFLETNTVYTDPAVAAMIEEQGWMLWPPIPFHYDTHILDLGEPAPSPPSTRNWLGTDDQARDVLARLIYGFRISVLFALVLTLLSSIIGIAAGAVQGYFGGWVDLLFQRFIEIWSGLPRLYLLIILASVVTPNFWWLLGLLLLFQWMALVGVVRAEFLRARNFDYVRAARALGVGDLRTIVRHVLPNAMVAATTFLPFITSGAVVTLTALDFLGFGMPPGAPSLGELLRQGKDNLQAPWLGFTGFTVLAMMLSLLVFIGEGVRDAFDPRKTFAGLGGPVTDDRNAGDIGVATQVHGAAVSGERLIDVQDLWVRFASGGGHSDVVRGVDVCIAPGESVALVGESGSGKSVTALSIVQLLPYPPASHPRGRILFKSEDLVGASRRRLQAIRGDQISMVFQEPMTSLNPLHNIEKQIAEVLLLHRGMRRQEARQVVLELLQRVGIRNPEQRLGSYPHELSGGQRQRVMIAMALANKPDLLIADEPTTAVDVTVQAQLLDLLARLRREQGMALLFITHDLNIVRKIAERVYVMHEGRIVETGPTRDLLSNPRHPYTQRLLAAEPAGTPPPVRSVDEPLLRCHDLRVWYPIKGGLLRRTKSYIRAVDGVDLAVRRGETIGIVGESGSGKSTLALALLRLISSRGEIRFDGSDLRAADAESLVQLRRRMQIVFQDPYGSLSPRLSVGQIIAEGMIVHGVGGNADDRDRRIVAMLREVGLDPDSRHRYPHEFSGGQRQRIAIARAMVLEPDLLVLDEPTSALDRSVQAQIVDLLRRLQRERNLAYLFISHDLRLVRAMSHRILVLHQGLAVEQGPAEEVFTRPRDPYTRSLLQAALAMESVGNEEASA